MEKREKIIVIMAILAAAYGVIDFTLSAKKKNAATSPTFAPAVQNVSSEEIGSLISDDNKKMARIAALMNENWSRQVFAAGAIEFDGEKKIDSTREALLNELKEKASQFFYSGFVSMNDDRIAIINGMDYRVGEQIEGFTISKITMDAVQVTASEANFNIPASVELSPQGPAPESEKSEQK